MAEFKLGTSPLTGVIYAGNVKNNMWSGKKHDVTDTAVLAVAQHLLQKDEKVRFEYKGEEYELKVEKVKEQLKQKP